MANVLMRVVGVNLIGVFVLGDHIHVVRRREDFADFVAVVRVTALLTIA